MEFILDRQRFELRNGLYRHFVKSTGTRILCWTPIENHYEMYSSHILFIPYLDVTEDSLKSLGLWDTIKSSQQSLIQAMDRGETQEIEDMLSSEVPQKGRRQKYSSDIPRSLTCECGSTTTIGPGLLLQKAEEAGQTYQEYAAGYQCRKCKPHDIESGKGSRGRKADPRYIGLPRTIHCSECQKPSGIGPGLLLSTAKDAGLTWEEWVKTYKCRKCKGSSSSSSSEVRGGRPSNPKYEGIPKKLKCCKCEGMKGTTPEQYLKQVAKSGKSRKAFEKSYKCRSCRK
jgi:hypothetical protein